MIQAAIFDIDGTLMDSMWVWEQAFIEYVRSRGIEPQIDAGSKLFTMTLSEGSIFLKQELDVPDTPEQIMAAVAGHARELYLSKVQLKPNVLEFLQSLDDAGVPMSILTSGERELSEEVFAKLGLSGYFQKIYAATNEGISKREPDLYLRATAEMGVTPERTVVFEDAVYAVTVAKAAGFHTVGIKDSHSEMFQDDLRALAELYWERYPREIPPELFAF